MAATQIRCVGAIVRDERGRLLMVRRKNDPGAGLWSVPGGRIEDGETGEQAVMREVLEETGVHITLTGLAGVVERPAPDGDVFVIEDFYARVETGTDPHAVSAGDDATEAGWYPLPRVLTLDCVPGLVDQLKEWRVL